MTIKEYLSSREFKKEYKCWNYAHKIYGEDGKNLLEDDYFEWWDDEKANYWLNRLQVYNVEQGWELGDDHEMYAFAKIFTCINPGYMAIQPCNKQKEDSGDGK